MINQDMHLHSQYSDGRNTLEEMVLKAIELGIEEICFTDHVWKTTTWIGDYLKEIEFLSNKYDKKLKIHAGVEAKLLNHKGELDIPCSVQNKQIRIVGSIHRIPSCEGGYIRKSEIKGNLKKSREMWLESFKSFKLCKNLTCIGHPFSLLPELGVTSDDFTFWSVIIETLNETDVEIEYNVKYDNSIVPNWFWRKYKNRIVFASDSHSIKDLENRLKFTRALSKNKDLFE